MIGFIGGTGVSDLPGLAPRAERITTRWGTAELRRGTVAGRPVVFLARHGAGHTVPPHAVDHRANLAALKAVGVTAVVASSAVGTLAEAVPPGSLALVGDLLDLRSSPPPTFFEREVVHLDAGALYCPCLRATLAAAAKRCGLMLAPPAIYAQMPGPRFETPAEIRALRALGADLVGMTNGPEAVLARELELCYAAVAMATNHAAGLAAEPLTHGEVEAAVAARAADLRRLFEAVVADGPPADCACRHALDEARRRRGEPGFGVPLEP